ncbi:hypothetical protein CTAYLR_000700 [Chrysophaeum taylorii]|uniref:Uncharacterized protein n=1 Tax=Chrysophaeum taylorii TaxID=2483200 RepID=A0AAD7U8U8_9STRA|nr:hypothetical protein CTAYLR_000700 [Chrysophaeum taylorii]
MTCSLVGRVHAFYYLWYGNPDQDGRWVHWNHDVLPHWDPVVRARYPTNGTSFLPPDEIHAPFYPLLGPYSSRDPAILDTHFGWMEDIDTVVLSWTGRESVSDTQGVSTDEAFPAAIAAAKKNGLSVALHLEPYPGRSARSVRSDLEYLLSSYDFGECKVVAYVYDAYHVRATEWKDLFCRGGAFTVRGTAWDVVALATFLTPSDRDLLTTGCFDGVYTYFATDGFTYGSSRRNWPRVVEMAHALGKIVSLSAGPGYNDTKIRPWNARATRARDGGRLFKRALVDAFELADVVSITSFNEWGEGTQIEPAISRESYLDYGPNPRLYLDVLKETRREADLL